MQTASAEFASQNFSAILDAVAREPVRIQRNDQEVAVVLSAAEYTWLKRDRWAELNQLSEAAAEEAKANGLTEETLAEILAER